MTDNNIKADSTAPDELGLFPRAHPRLGSNSNPVLIAALLVFFLSIAATLIADTIPGEKKKSQTIGREKKRESKRRQQAKWSDGTRAQSIERQLRIKSKTRRVVGGQYAALLYRHLNEAQDKCVVGPDGWLFAANRTRLPEVSDLALARRSARRISALWRRLEASGMKVLVMPVPRKCVVESEHLPEGAQVRPDADALLIQELKLLGVRVSDLLPLYASVDEPLYQKTDTHWNEKAQLVAAEAVIKELGVLSDETELATEIRENGKRRAGFDLLRFAGLDRESALEEAERQVGHAAYDVFDGDQVVKHKNPEAMPRIAMIGTSFSAKRKFPNYLSHFAGEIVWNGALAAEKTVFVLAEFLKQHAAALPEILILEIPNHLIFNETSLNDYGGVFAAAPRPRFQALSSALKPTSHLGSEVRSIDAEPTSLLTLPKGRFLHDGAGCVSLMLTGQVQGADLQVVMRAGDQSLVVPWPKTNTDLFIPVVGIPSGKEIHVSVQTTKPGELASLAFGGASWTCDVDVNGARDIALTKVDGSWKLQIDGSHPSHSALILDVNGNGIIEMAASDSDGEILLNRQYEFSDSGTAVVNLNPLASHKSLSIVIRSDQNTIELRRVRLASGLSNQ